MDDNLFVSLCTRPGHLTLQIEYSESQFGIAQYLNLLKVAIILKMLE